MFRSPPATRHPSRRLAGTSRLLLPFGVSLLLLCTPHPAGPGSPLGYLTLPHPSVLVCPGRFPASEGGESVVGATDQREAEPAAACRVQASGLVCPSPVSGTRFPPKCSPGFPDVSWAPQVSASGQAAPSSPRPSSPASSPSPLTPVQGPLACSCPTVCDPCRPTGGHAGVPSSRH